MTAQNPGQDLIFSQTGSGPAILFLHTDPARQQALFHSCANLTASRLKVVVALVAPGGDETRQIITLLKQLGIGRAVVIALGTANQTLVELLERHPERIAAASFVADRTLAHELRQRTNNPRIHALLRSGQQTSLAQALANARPVSAYGAVQAWSTRIVAQCRNGIKSCSALLSRLDLPGLIQFEDGDRGEEEVIEAF